MGYRYSGWMIGLIGIVGCTEEEPHQPIPVPTQIDVSSDTALSYLSCMADHPPLVNPIVFWAYSVADGEDYCLDDVYGIRLYFNDARFLDNPLGVWQFTGEDGLLSLEPDDGTPRFRSELDAFRERETDVEYCLNHRATFEEVNLSVTKWDWISFEVSYDGTLANGDVVTGHLSGLWREDVNDCD